MKRVQPGLSLVEVLIAVLMLGLSVTTLFSLQGVLSRGVFGVHAMIDRMPYIKSLFIEVDRDKLFKSEAPIIRTVEHPALRMNYSVEAAPSKALRAYSQLRLEKVQAEWSTAFGTCKETFARLRFIPAVERK